MADFITKDLLEIIEDCFGILADEVEFSSKYMFGGALCYAYGRPFISITKFGIGVNLPPNEFEEFIKIEGSRLLKLKADSPPNKNYLLVPIAWHSETEELLPVLLQSAAYVKTLPPPKKRKKKS